MRTFLIFLALIAGGELTAMAEPPLPEGLGQEQKKPPAQQGPTLPPGLEAQTGPALPPGLGDKPSGGQDALSEDEGLASGLGLNLSGFIDVRSGLRLQRDPYQKAASLGEARLQLSADKELDFATAKVTADLLYDPVVGNQRIGLEEGRGWLDLREASLLFRPTGFADLKVGRQILTWGTGDLLFINDMFPKDWNAFFIGRDEEYLKTPSDAAKLSLFSGIGNLDVIYTPRFDADRFIDGGRLSYFNPSLGSLAGRNARVQTDRPDDWFGDDELALRFYRNMGSAEVALYFYDGFWKSPAGQSAVTGLARFPRLRSYGASVRRPFLGGIAHAEVGFYDSLEDGAGADPFVANSEVRLLVGYERELAPELTGAVQYYQERLLDYAPYLASLPTGMPVRDKRRHVLTARITKLAMNQTLTWSLFAYYSPSDRDAYLRPKVTRKITDNWTAELGANLFFGKENYTFFGQFEKNTNVFLSLRRGF